MIFVKTVSMASVPGVRAIICWPPPSLLLLQFRRNGNNPGFLSPPVIWAWKPRKASACYAQAPEQNIIFLMAIMSIMSLDKQKDHCWPCSAHTKNSDWLPSFCVITHWPHELDTTLPSSPVWCSSGCPWAPCINFVLYTKPLDCNYCWPPLSMSALTRRW